MNMIDCMIDEFHDEAIIKGMEDREITSWLEVRICSSEYLPITVKIWLSQQDSCV